jgi:hypothetical protein
VSQKDHEALVYYLEYMAVSVFSYEWRHGIFVKTMYWVY